MNLIHAHGVANYINSSRQVAVKLIQKIADCGAGKLVVCVYHHCSEAWVEAKSSVPQNWTVPLPYECPECGTEIEDASDLNYDIAIYLPGDRSRDETVQFLKEKLS